MLELLNDFLFHVARLGYQSSVHFTSNSALKSFDKFTQSDVQSNRVECLNEVMCPQWAKTFAISYRFSDLDLKTSELVANNVAIERSRYLLEIRFSINFN